MIDAEQSLFARARVRGLSVYLKVKCNYTRKAKAERNQAFLGSFVVEAKNSRNPKQRDPLARSSPVSRRISRNDLCPLSARNSA